MRLRFVTNFTKCAKRTRKNPKVFLYLVMTWILIGIILNIQWYDVDISSYRQNVAIKSLTFNCVYLVND